MSALSKGDLDVLIEAAHPSRPDRRELVAAHLERIVAARLAPIEALADVWSSPESLRHGAWIRERDAADRIRDALKAAR